MVFARRRKNVRKNMKRRRNVRRSRVRAQALVHRFKRTCKMDNITASVTAGGVGSGISAAYQFTLDSLPNYTEFTALYDMYKINAIKLTFVPTASEYINSTTSGAPTPNGFQRFNSVLDFDDTAVPVNENELLQYATLKNTPGWRSHTRYFKPRILQTVDEIVGATLGSSSSSPKWISCLSPSVEHLGVKIFVAPPIVGSAVGAAITYSVYATYYISCRNTK